MQNDFTLVQIRNFGFTVVKKSRDHSKDRQINNLEFFTPKIPRIFLLQKIGEAVRNYFSFLYTDFFTVVTTVKNSFYKRGDRRI
jgi:hypothetical protein